jgi:hypothetical protein
MQKQELEEAMQARKEAEEQQKTMKAELVAVSQREQKRETEIQRIQNILKEKSNFAQTVQRDLTTVHQQVAEMHRTLQQKAGRLKGTHPAVNRVEHVCKLVRLTSADFGCCVWLSAAQPLSILLGACTRWPAVCMSSHLTESQRPGNSATQHVRRDTDFHPID